MKKKFFYRVLAVFAVLSIFSAFCVSTSAVQVPVKNNILNGAQIVFTVAPAGGSIVSYRGYLANTDTEYPSLLLQDSQETFDTFPVNSKYNITITFPNPVSFYNQNMLLHFYSTPSDGFNYDLILNGSGIAYGITSSGTSTSACGLASDDIGMLTVSGSAIFDRQDFLVTSLEFSYENTSGISLEAMKGLVNVLQGHQSVSNSPTGSSGFYFSFTQRYWQSYNYGWQMGFPSGISSATTSFDKTIVEERLNAKEEGYDLGYQDGMNAASNSYGFNDLFLGIAGVPFGFISSMLNFEILGVNMAGFFFSIITLLIVGVLVIKFI